MTTQLFAKSEKKLSPYFAVYREFLTATGWKGWEQVKVKNPEGKMVATGEVKEVVYPFTSEEKMLWSWMLDRYQFFKANNNVWFDNQDEIAAYTGFSVSTVKRFIKKLSVSGVLVIATKNMGGARVSNSYVITKDLVLVQRENVAQKPSISPVVERSEQPNTNAQAEVYVELEAAGEAWVHEAIPDYDYDYYEPSVDDQDMDSNYYNPEDLKEKAEKNIAPAPGKKSIFEPWMFTSKNLNSFKKGSEWDECLINFMLDSGIAEPYRVLTGGDDNDFSFMGDRYQFNARSGFIIPSELPF